MNDAGGEKVEIALALIEAMAFAPCAYAYDYGYASCHLPLPFLLPFLYFIIQNFYWKNLGSLM